MDFTFSTSARSSLRAARSKNLLTGTRLPSEEGGKEEGGGGVEGGGVGGEGVMLLLLHSLPPVVLYHDQLPHFFICPKQRRMLESIFTAVFLISPNVECPTFVREETERIEGYLQKLTEVRLQS